MTETRDFQCPELWETVDIPLNLNGDQLTLTFRCVSHTKEGSVLLADRLLFTGLPFDDKDCSDWDESSIKRWLNDTFLTALPAEVRKRIVTYKVADAKVFLFSVNELKNNFWLKNHGLECKVLGSSNTWEYWARDAQGPNSSEVPFVTLKGCLCSVNAMCDNEALRPAFVIETRYQDDNQDKIDDDATLHPVAYCEHILGKEDCWISEHDQSELIEAMVADLLRRQRKLDGAQYEDDKEL